MSYMDRLKAKILETCPPDELTKLTQPGFVSFVSDPSGHVCQKSEPVPPSTQPLEPRHRERADPDISGGWGLPAELFWSIRRLDLHPGGRQIENKDLWPGLVIDTTLFAQNGWAAKALALGWSEMELFGLASCGWQGVTSRLVGRKVLDLGAYHVKVQDGHTTVLLPRMPLSDGAVPLWDFGR